ncbi:MAG: peroxiredoxin [Spirochaetales bacterium]|nr:peroxiredoxin [Spirochaetales bacterium]
MLKKGDIAPDFPLTHDGQATSLHKLSRPVVLFFYPGDFTAVCTREACAFRDHGAEFQQKGALLFGISRDDEESHQRFAATHSLTYELISDPDLRIAKAYQVIRSIPFLPSRRLTYVLDAEARILGVIGSDLNVGAHVQGALKLLGG